MPKKNPDIELDEIANEVGERIAMMSKGEEEYGRNMKRIIAILQENADV
jgi:hypothetical protein